MQTLKPGILVSLKTTLHGNVRYDRRDLESNTDANTATARWETVKTVEDVAEHTRATEVRGAARSTVARVCIASNFGLICPTERAEELEQAMEEARAQVSAFNASATRTRVNLYVLSGRIADNDEEATRAIASEVTELLTAMQDGITRIDVEAIREAASRAKRIGGMLEASYGDRVNAAVDAARRAAREIVRRVTKAGEDAQTVLGEVNTSAINQARFAFLDLTGEEAPAPAPAIPSTNAQRVASLFDDMPDEDPGMVDEAPAPVPAGLDLDTDPTDDPSAYAMSTATRQMELD